MSSPRPLPDTDSEICMVVQWKDVVNESSPWWRRLYYRTIYKWFMEFSLKVMKIPNPTEVTIDGKQVRFSWLEHQGFFDSEDAADLACLGPRWGYKRIIFGRAFPKESGQYDSPWIYPRAKNPRKRAKPILKMIITPRETTERLVELERQIKELRRVIHQ